MKDYETGLDRQERLILHLLAMIRMEKDTEKKKEYQNMINEIIKPKDNISVPMGHLGTDLFILNI